MIRYGQYQNKFYFAFNPKDPVHSQYTSGSFSAVEGSGAFGIHYQFRGIYLEAYGGIGIRQKNSIEQVKSTCVGCKKEVLLNTSNENAPFEEKSQVLPALKLGLRFGVSF